VKVCSKCGLEKELSEFYKDKFAKNNKTYSCKMCINLSRIRYLKNNPWYTSLANARARCNNPKNPDYKDYGGRGIKVELVISQIKELWFRDKAYLMKCPTINRKDNNGNYTFDNCEFIEMGLNSAERNKRVIKPIVQYDLNNSLITIWPSATEVERQLGFDQGNISKCCLGKVSSAYKFIWRFQSC